MHAADVHLYAFFHQPIDPCRRLCLKGGGRRKVVRLHLRACYLWHQEEIEAALLKAARDQVDNLMQVVDKMQTQQTKLLVTLQSEKKKVSTVSAHSTPGYVSTGCCRRQVVS